MVTVFEQLLASVTVYEMVEFPALNPVTIQFEVLDATLLLVLFHTPFGVLFEREVVLPIQMAVGAVICATVGNALIVTVIVSAQVPNL